MKPNTYSRRFLRIKPYMPIFGEIRLVNAGGRPVVSNWARVRLLDISSGGVRFVSVLRLPIDTTVVIELSMDIEGKRHLVKGYIVRAFNTQVNGYEYGYCFLQQEPKLKHVLIKIFNTGAFRQGRYIIFKMSHGCEKEI